MATIKNTKITPKEGKENPSMFSLSRYCRQYYNEDGEPRGLKLTGYTSTQDGKREYTNIWIREGYKLRDLPNGHVVLTIDMYELEHVGQKEDNA